MATESNQQMHILYSKISEIMEETNNVIDQYSKMLEKAKKSQERTNISNKKPSI